MRQALHTIGPVKTDRLIPRISISEEPCGFERPNTGHQCDVFRAAIACCAFALVAFTRTATVLIIAIAAVAGVAVMLVTR